MNGRGGDTFRARCVVAIWKKLHRSARSYALPGYSFGPIWLRTDAGLDNRQISAYCSTVRRKPDQLLPLEIEILEVALVLERRGVTRFHGYSLAKLLQESGGRRLLTAHGTLYRALHRLEIAGLIEASWEDPQVAESERRPRRRMYGLLGAAEPAVRQARAAESTRSRRDALEPDLERP